MNARKCVHAQKPYPSQAFAHESSKVEGRETGKTEAGRLMERKAAQQNKITSEELKQGQSDHLSTCDTNYFAYRGNIFILLIERTKFNFDTRWLMELIFIPQNPRDVSENMLTDALSFGFAQQFLMLKSRQAILVSKSIEAIPMCKSIETVPVFKSREAVQMFKSREAIPTFKSIEAFPVSKSCEAIPASKSRETSF